jgi:hypothetical protein
MWSHADTPPSRLQACIEGQLKAELIDVKP